MRKLIFLDMTAWVACAALAAACSRQPVATPRPVKVKTMQAQRQTVADGQVYSGTVEETAGTALSFAVSGTVTQVCVHEGQRVAKGTLVAVLDETTLRDAHAATEAAKEQAEDAYRRMKQLYEAGSLPEIDWVEVQSNLKQAQSAERMARKQLDDARLYAPFAGVVSQKTVEVGQNVMPGMQVAKLVTVRRVKVNVAVPESEISHVKVGQAVVVTVPALGDRVFVGKVTEKGIAAHPLSRTYSIKAEVDNASGDLLPGMIGNMQIATSASAMHYVLPSSVVQTDEHNRHYLWLAEKGKAVRRPVVLGTLLPEGVVIASGLAEGDWVIVEGQQKISEGISVAL